MSAKFVKIGDSLFNVDTVRAILMNEEEGSITVEFKEDHILSVTIWFNIPSICEHVFNRAVDTLCK